MIFKEIIWEHKWKFIVAVGVIGFIILFLTGRSKNSWRELSNWLIKKKKETLKERVEIEKEKIKKNKEKVEDIDKELEKLEKQNEKIDQAISNKDLDELAKESKKLGY